MNNTMLSPDSRPEMSTWPLALMMLMGIIPLYSMPSSNFPDFWFVILLANTLVIFFLAVYHFRSSLFLLYFCIVIYVFQNFLMGAFNPDGNLKKMMLLLAYSLLLPIFAITTSLIHGGFEKMKHYKIMHLVAFIYVSCMVINFLTSPMPTSARIPALRNTVAPLMLFYAAYLLPNISFEDLKRFTRFVFIFSILISIFGVIELFVLGDAFWNKWLNIQQIMATKHVRGTPGSLYRVPTTFYAAVAGEHHRRMVSFFGAPLSAGYFMAFATLLTLYDPRKMGYIKKIFLCSLIFLGMVLTLAKGAYLICAVGIFYYLIIGKLKSKILTNRLVLFMSFILIVIMSILLVIQSREQVRSTAAVHMAGLYLSFDSILTAPMPTMLFGHSLGTGGVTSSLLTGLKITSGTGGSSVVSGSGGSGGESGIGTLVYQTGAVGLALYIAVMFLIVSFLLEAYSRNRERGHESAAYFRVVFSAFCGLLIAGLYQEIALALIPPSLYCFAAGLGLNMEASIHGEEDKEK